MLARPSFALLAVVASVGLGFVPIHAGDSELSREDIAKLPRRDVSALLDMTIRNEARPKFSPTLPADLDLL